VTLRDIAGELGMRAASLYNHAPGGKEQLFIMVTERGLARHESGIAEAVRTAQPSLSAQLRAIAQWLLTNTPLNFDRMYHSDMPAIAPAEAERLSRLAYQAIIAPIRQVMTAAADRAEIDRAHTETLAAVFVTSIEAIRELERRAKMPQPVALESVLHVLLDGARPRPSVGRADNERTG
jgi:AcrR family transcriptional regulator